VLNCSDSRVIPEYIFDAANGQLFIIRLAVNVAMDSSILTYLEYAVDHFHVEYTIILGHTNCGDVKSSENTTQNDYPIFREIQESFSIDPDNHIMANLKRQLLHFPKGSTSINNAIQENTLKLIVAIYHLENGTVEFFE